MTQHTRPALEDHAGVDLTRRELGRYLAGGSQSDTTRTTLVVIAGVHGNEPAGAHAAQRVLDTLQREQPSAFDGELVALLGNLEALNHEQPDTRYIAHDLNRLFTDEQIALPPETSPEHGQMQELLASLRSIRARCDRMVVVDLHTTSADMPPVVVLEDSIPTRRMARKLPLPLYLGFEEELGGLLIDRVTNELGAISMVVEGGQHLDPKAADVLEAVIWCTLDSSGVLPINALSHEQDPAAVLRHEAGDERGGSSMSGTATRSPTLTSACARASSTATGSGETSPTSRPNRKRQSLHRCTASSSCPTCRRSNARVMTASSSSARSVRVGSVCRLGCADSDGSTGSSPTCPGSTRAMITPSASMPILRPSFADRFCTCWATASSVTMSGAAGTG